MKRVLLFLLFSVIAAVALLTTFSPEIREKGWAVGEALGRLVTGSKNPGVVAESAERIISAKHNLDVVERAAEYIATIGSNTLVYREVMRVASSSDVECPRLGKVLDLAVVCQTDSYRIIALAKKACNLSTPEQEAAWQREFDDLWGSAQYPSVEEALKALRKQ